jgi:hypothetical protein
MSFVNKIKGWVRRARRRIPSRSTATSPSPITSTRAMSAARRWRRPTWPFPTSTSKPPRRSTPSPAPPAWRRPGGSIISEAVPSEIADFTETRVQGADSGAAPLAASLPMIGQRPVVEQQRILLGLLVLGLIGLIGLALYSFFAARGGSTQVGATGQAMMQSQRLAKSVSQAIVGSASSFPEVKESAEVLASNVRSLKASAPAALRSRSTRSCRWSTAPRRTPASSSRSRRR